METNFSYSATQLSTNVFNTSSPLNVVGEDVLYPLPVRYVVPQTDSVHHYELTDSDRTWVDIDLTNYATSVTARVNNGQIVPVTTFDRLTEVNEDLKRIRVFKRDVAPQIFSEFQKALKK
jgi:hypothetical protein